MNTICIFGENKMKKKTKIILISVGIVAFLGILTIPCFLYEPLNLWIKWFFDGF